MRRYSMLAAVLMVVMIAPALALSQSFTDKAKKDSAVEMSDEEPAMQKAMERADGFRRFSSKGWVSTAGD